VGGAPRCRGGASGVLMLSVSASPGCGAVDRGDSVAGAPVDERPIGEPIEESHATQPGALTIIAPTVTTAGGSAFAGGVWGYFGLADHLYQPIRGLGNRGQGPRKDRPCGGFSVDGIRFTVAAPRAPIGPESAPQLDARSVAPNLVSPAP
jgi:hypothetical protein